jgi:hypothetical protein
MCPRAAFDRAVAASQAPRSLNAAKGHRKRLAEERLAEEWLAEEGEVSDDEVDYARFCSEVDGSNLFDPWSLRARHSSRSSASGTASTRAGAGAHARAHGSTDSRTGKTRHPGANRRSQRGRTEDT